MIRIKVCGMYDPVNVKDIAEAKPDFMGFIFYPGSPRYVGGKPDLALFLNVPFPIQKTGVFVNEDIETIAGSINKCIRCGWRFRLDV